MAELPRASGYLVVAVTTKTGALPLEGALVTVSAPVDGQMTLYRVARTDSSGRTPQLELPAPVPAESLRPDQPTPYSSYTVTVDRDGFQSVSDLGVSIFPGVTATLPVWMEPGAAELPQVQENDFPPEVLDTKGGQ